jgi:hypothetical protein
MTHNNQSNNNNGHLIANIGGASLFGASPRVPSFASGTSRLHQSSSLSTSTLSSSSSGLHDHDHTHSTLAIPATPERTSSQIKFDHTTGGTFPGLLSPLPSAFASSMPMVSSLVPSAVPSTQAALLGHVLESTNNRARIGVHLPPQRSKKTATTVATSSLVTTPSRSTSSSSLLFASSPMSPRPVPASPSPDQTTLDHQHHHDDDDLSPPDNTSPSGSAMASSSSGRSSAPGSSSPIGGTNRRGHGTARQAARIFRGLDFNATPGARLHSKLEDIKLMEGNDAAAAATTTVPSSTSVSASTTSVTTPSTPLTVRPVPATSDVDTVSPCTNASCRHYSTSATTSCQDCRRLSSFARSPSHPSLTPPRSPFNSIRQSRSSAFSASPMMMRTHSRDGHDDPSTPNKIGRFDGPSPTSNRRHASSGNLYTSSGRSSSHDDPSSSPPLSPLNTPASPPLSSLLLHSPSTPVPPMMSVSSPAHAGGHGGTIMNRRRNSSNGILGNNEKSGPRSAALSAAQTMAAAAHHINDDEGDEYVAATKASITGDHEGDTQEDDEDDISTPTASAPIRAPPKRGGKKGRKFARGRGRGGSISSGGPSNINATASGAAATTPTAIPSTTSALSASVGGVGGTGIAGSSSDANHGKTKPCNCKKSKCLKLYCECFAALGYCRDCNCTGCNNTPQFETQRQKAIASTLERAADAFHRASTKGAAKVVGSTATGRKGCHCKKSHCQKKYCECYQLGLKCNELCKCLVY